MSRNTNINDLNKLPNFVWFSYLMMITNPTNKIKIDKFQCNRQNHINKYIEYKEIKKIRYTKEAPYDRILFP